MHISTIFVEDKTKPGKYIMLKKGEVRVKDPKAQMTLKPIDPRDEDQTLDPFMAKELERITKFREKQGWKSELKKVGKKEVRSDSKKEGERATSASSLPVDVPIFKKSRFSKGIKIENSSQLNAKEIEEAAEDEMREDVPLSRYKKRKVDDAGLGQEKAEGYIASLVPMPVVG